MLFCRNKQFRIDHCSVKYNAPVKMRAGGAPCHSGKPDRLTFGYSFAGLHVDPVKVAVQGDQPVAMVDKNRFAVEEIITNRQHLALRARLDRCAAGYHHIKARMGCAGLAIEESAHTEAPTQFPFSGENESQIGVLRCAPVVFQFLDERYFAFCASQVGSREFYLALVLKREALCSDISLD